VVAVGCSCLIYACVCVFSLFKQFTLSSSQAFHKLFFLFILFFLSFLSLAMACQYLSCKVTDRENGHFTKYFTRRNFRCVRRWANSMLSVT
jgi:hypothetical protein